MIEKGRVSAFFAIFLEIFGTKLDNSKSLTTFVQSMCPNDT